MQLTVKKISEICKGTIYCGDENVVCTNFVKDTREIQKGDTYVALIGANFDGNQFYKEAFRNGANCVILTRSKFVPDENYTCDLPIILVEDTILALKDLATYVRDNSESLFVGVTGSVGKTSTRDMIYSVLSTHYKTLKTEGNYNNNIGLPLTILRLQDEDAAVIEMGMNHLGEISYLSTITKPAIGVITNVGTAHIGELKSRENILKAKLEILDGMDNTSKLIINNDNDLLHEYYKNNQENIITIGIDNKSDYQAKNIEYFDTYSKFTVVYDNQEYEITSPVAGKSFVYNSLVAFAVGINANVPVEKIQKGIQNFSLTKGRLEIIDLTNFKIIDDSYNASVDSMKSSLEILKSQKSKRKIAVLGSMFELGDFSRSLHEEVGKSVMENSIDILVTVGVDAKYIASSAIASGMDKENVKTFLNNQDAIEYLKEEIKRGDILLVKASNGMKFKEIVTELKNM